MKTKDLARQWFEEIWKGRKPDLIFKLMHENASGVTETGNIKGPYEFMTRIYQPMMATFPDIQVTIDGVLEEGDESVVRWTATATQLGELLDIPASRRRISFSGMTWLRFSDGRIVEGADRYNFHGVLSYLRNGIPSATVRNAA